MTVKFVNHSKYEALICINDGEAQVVGGKSSMDVAVETDFFCVSVQRNVQNTKIEKKQCIIKTEYHVFGAAENSLFHIDREKIAVGASLSYDAMLLSSENAECKGKTYGVANAEEIKKDFNKWNLLEIFILDPLFDLIFDGGIFLVGFFVLLGIFVNWYLAIALLVGLYILDVVTALIGDKLGDICCKKVFKVKPPKEELCALLDGENIKAFYANPARKPWAGEIDRD